MFYNVFVAFNMPEHHCCRCFHSHPVCSLHYFNPTVSADLIQTDNLSHAIAQYLRTAARKRIKPRFPQPFQCFSYAQPLVPRNKINLRGRQTVKLYAREFVFYRGKQIFKPFNTYFRRQPTLNEDLRSAYVNRFPNFPQYLFLA